MTTIKRTSSQDLDFQNLVQLLDRDLAIRDGDDHAFYAQYNGIDAIQHALVYYHNKQAVGCGAFKVFDTNAVEIKRMFVLPQFRSKRIGASMLKELEIWAAEMNYLECVLETGKKNPEALHLYEKEGYKIIPNYGQYKNISDSICMTKRIK